MSIQSANAVAKPGNSANSNKMDAAPNRAVAVQAKVAAAAGRNLALLPTVPIANAAKIHWNKSC